MTCPLCGGAFDEPFVDRRDVPVHQNQRITDPDDARRVARGDVVLANCTQCSFVSNVAFDPDLVDYRGDYENSQICSPSFNAHADSMAERLLRAGARGARVVEIGCGNGYFLRRVVEGGAASGIGYDTTYRGPAEPAPGLRFETSYLDAATGPPVRAPVVVSRHVIEHVPRPLDLLATAAAVVDAGGVVAVETPDLGWILDGVVVQDFFYEHCSYFTHITLAAALARVGLADADVRSVFGEQYLWAESHRPGAEAHPGEPARDAGLAGRIDRYRHEEQRRLDHLSARIDAMAGAGKVAVWGAGAKGVTFCNLLDPGAARIAAVIDVNPAKQGCFVAGTGHPIVSPETLREHGVTDVLVMNPHYLDECTRDGRRHVPHLRLWSEATGWE